MIPKFFHFIYVGGRPFSFIHFLAVFTAWKVNCPERLYFHHTVEPTGIWWEKARPYLTLNQVEPVNQVDGNPIKYPAHMADVIRMAVLQQFGGVYLDLDIISVNPLEPLLQHNFVMGIEPGTGLCNAVILATADATFLKNWRAQYRTFDSRRWNYHSVVLPWKLAQEQPENIHIEDKYSFFYPTHNDPVHHYLWGQRPSVGALLNRLGKNVVKLTAYALSGKPDAIKRAYYQTFHGLRSQEWHYQKARQSYCLHLWEGLWGEPYLKAVTPEYLQLAPTHFARLLREIVSAEELRAMSQEGPMLQAH